ncbi:MAG: nuclear transport factor 2 family protein [Pseudomonadota bacterium]
MTTGFANQIIKLTLCLMLCVSTSTLSAENEPCTCGVEAALTEFLNGAANNPTAHDRFWAEPLIYTSSRGERFGKAEIMAGFEQDDTADEDQSPPVYSAEDVTIRFENELALLTFTLVAETPTEAEASIQRYYNSGVLKNSAVEGESPHWQAVLWQATRIPEPVAATLHEQQ